VASLELRIAIRDATFAKSHLSRARPLRDTSRATWIAFCGSANESSWRVYEGNFESVDVFRSWVPRNVKTARPETPINSERPVGERTPKGWSPVLRGRGDARLLKARPERQAEAGPRPRRKGRPPMPMSTVAGLEEVLLIPAIFTSASTRNARPAVVRE